MNTIQIKNMVCPRCIQAVSLAFEEMGIETNHIGLGEVSIANPLSSDQKSTLSETLNKIGFEILEDKSSRIIEKIKKIVLEHLRGNERNSNLNISALLADQLNQEYTSLSRLFSSVEGITIERYLLRQKIEFVKELIFYDELNLSQIANKLNYSSIAHLSSQFKKETGMTPSAFKKLRKPGHQDISG